MNFIKKNKTILTIVSLFSLIACVYVVGVFSISHLFTNKEQKMIDTVSSDIDTFLTRESQSTKEEKLSFFNEILSEYPLELAIIKNNETLFSTIPGLEKINLDTTFQGSGTLFKSRESVQKDSNIYETTIVLGKPDFIANGSAFFGWLILLILIMFALSLWLSLWISKKLYKPLSTIRESITQIRGDGIVKEIDIQDQTVIGREFDAFLHEMQSGFSHILDDYTEMELLLMFEKEKLAISLEIIAAEVHALKTPLYTLVLKSETQIDTQETADSVEFPSTVITDMERVIDRINSINRFIRDTTSSEGNSTFPSETFDVIQLLIENDDQFTEFYNKRQLLVTINSDESLIVKTNKIMLNLIIQNILSNIAQYATEGSDVDIVVVERDNRVEFLFVNESSPANAEIIENIDSSEQIILGGRFSGGNGLRMNKKLAQYLNGEYLIMPIDGKIIQKLIISQGDE